MQSNFVKEWQEKYLNAKPEEKESVMLAFQQDLSKLRPDEYAEYEKQLGAEIDETNRFADEALARFSKQIA